MPIYAYKCDACGHAQDVLQKISDPLLTVCPACGASAFVKQVTAAGFQLKGSGWYVTDFRGGNNGPAKDDKKADGAEAEAGAKPAETTAAGSDKPAEKAAAKPVDKPADKPADKAAAKTAAPAPAAAPAAKAADSKPAAGR